MNYTSFKANLTLKVKVKVARLQTHLSYLNQNQNFGGFKANLTLKIKVKVTSFQTRPRPLCDQYLVQDKIQNNSKVIVFTRNHTDDDGTKNNMSPPGCGGGDIIRRAGSSSIPPGPTPCLCISDCCVSFLIHTSDPLGLGNPKSTDLLVRGSDPTNKGKKVEIYLS